MSDVVIRVENLTKEYRLGVINHGTLHQDLQSWWARMRGKEDPNSLISLGQHSSDLNYNPHLLALDDVSFDVKQGEILGIIGHNGAGKSTLLKILSRVTAPTKGTIKIKGRVASLLEVGTGFHPELTGRENIYLNGAILGMTKKEINSKFDEIVAFAEIEKFIDTPVKRYSSGMYVRLAFAVAAHLEPESLIVDEVLAVGDAAFQEKCLGKMGEVARGGRTVLFVSHNMEAVSILCHRGIMLSDGCISYMGEASETVSYYRTNILNSKISVDTCFTRGGSGGVQIANVWTSNGLKEKKYEITSSEPIYLNLTAIVGPEYQGDKNLNVGFAIDSFDGRRLFTSVSSWKNMKIIAKGETLEVRCCLPSLPLIPGTYLVSASIIHQMDTLDCAVHCASFEIINDDSYFYAHRTKDQGELNFPCRFEVLDV